MYHTRSLQIRNQFVLTNYNDSKNTYMYVIAINIGHVRQRCCLKYAGSVNL